MADPRVERFAELLIGYSTRIQPGDRVIVFALERTVSKLQSVFLAERRS